jgi:hypothetical protein
MTSNQMISEKTSKKLSTLMYSPTKLSTLYMEFVNKEPYCSKDVFTFLKSYTRTTLNSCGVFDIDMENPEILMTEEFSEMIEASNEVSQILMVIFAAGMAYGKSMFYEDFEQNFGAGIEVDKDSADEDIDMF